jgi:hypothetical protein
VIRLGLRLSLGGGKESIARLAVMALAVALGVGMLLATLAAINGLGRQNARGAWLATGPAVPNGSGTAVPPEASVASSSRAGSLWWVVNTEQFGNQMIVRADGAPAGLHPPVPPGIPRLPRPGQFYASPALTRLLRTTPGTELGDRFKGTEVGTIRPTALASPNDLVIVMGDSAAALDHAPGAGLIAGFATSAPSGGPDSLSSTGLQRVLAVMALVLLFPILVFIGTATRLSAARREQRFAAIRLVGATMRQLAAIAALEAALAAAVGTALGCGLYFLFHPALVHVTFTGQSFAPGDLSVSPTDILVVALGVPVAAAVTGLVALRRVAISPFGVSRRATPAPPRVYRLVPLLAGLAELAYFVAVGRPKSAGSQTGAYFLGFLLIMFGLVLAGPWFAMAGGRAMATYGRRAAVLIAGRRLSDNPRGAFRAISGLILALFVTSAAIGTIGTLLVGHSSTAAGRPASDTVVDIDQFAVLQSIGLAPPVPPAVISRLHAIDGVKGLTLVYTAPAGTKTNGRVPDINGLSGTNVPAVVTCSQLATTPALGRCHPGATFASVGHDIGFVPVTKPAGLTAETTWPTAQLPHGTAGLPVQTVAVATNGSSSAIERVQTILDGAFPLVSSVGLFGQVSPQDLALLTELQAASEVVIVASLLIAGCSLAVSLAAGLADRRRPFSQLRLAGAPMGMLRRVTGFEAAAPLVVIALAAALIGLVASDLFLRSQLGISLRMPGATYVSIVLGGLTASLVIVAATLPLLERTTRPQDVRAE